MIAIVAAFALGLWVGALFGFWIMALAVAAGEEDA